MAKPDTLLDTCCILNLCAVDEPRSVLSQIPFRLFVSPSVEREEISIRPSSTAARHERRKIDLAPCFASGVLNRCKLESEKERDLYVQLAQEVDDGEAMSLAIAASRKWAIATDDAAACKVASRFGVMVYATPQLLRLWAERINATDQVIQAAIIRIESLARYIPNPTTPEADWWVSQRLRR